VQPAGTQPSGLILSGVPPLVMLMNRPFQLFGTVIVTL
jgi:hypothetical protein